MRLVLQTHLRVVGRAEVAVLLDTPSGVQSEGVNARNPVVLPDDRNHEFSVSGVTRAAARVGSAPGGNDLVRHGETVANVAGILLCGFSANGQSHGATRQFKQIAGRLDVKHPELGLSAAEGIDPESVEDGRAVDPQSGAKYIVGGGWITRGQRFLEGVRRDEVLAVVDCLDLVVEEGGLRLPTVANVELDTRQDAENVALDVEETRPNLDQAMTEGCVLTKRVKRVGSRQDAPGVGVQVSKRRGRSHLLVDLYIPVGRLHECGGIIGHVVIDTARCPVSLVFGRKGHPRVVVKTVDARGTYDLLGGRCTGATGGYLVEAGLITVL